MGTPPEAFEAWASRAWAFCEDDPECWEWFMHSSTAHAKTSEAKQAIINAFHSEVLPRLLEEAKEVWLERFGADLTAWRRFIEEAPPEFRREIAEFIARELKDKIEKAVNEALQNPEARRHFRTYMKELVDDLILGYTLGLTQRDVARIGGYSLHSVWNTTWWLRKYAGVDLWPPYRE